MYSKSDTPLGEEAVVLPLLGENNPLSAGLRVGVSSAGKDIFQYIEIHKFLTNSQSNCSVNFSPASGM